MFHPKERLKTLHNYKNIKYQGRDGVEINLILPSKFYHLSSNYHKCFPPLGVRKEAPVADTSVFYVVILFNLFL